MRYLRMLSNSAFAGLLAAVYLTWLLLHLNPSVPLSTTAITAILTVMVLSYGIHIFVVSYVLYVVRQIALGEPSSPGWISLRLLTWSAAALSGAAAVITWLHASGLRTTLEPRVLPLLTRTAGLFAGAAALFLLLAIAQLAARRRGRATVAMLFTLATITSIAAPLFVLRGTAPREGAPHSGGERGAGLQPPAPASGRARIQLVCLDGASLEFISPAVAAGRLPNFGRLLDRGVSMHLTTTRPTQPEPAWASIVTGKWPAQHGIRGPARYRVYNSDVRLDVLPDYLFFQALVRVGLLVAEPHSSSSIRAQPLWRVLDTHGIASGIIGLPLTHPEEPVRGFIVSDRAHLAEQGTAPRAGLDLVARSAERGSLLTADAVHQRLAAQLPQQHDVRLLAVRYPGLDAVGHYYLRFAQPDAFGDVSEDERRLYSRVLDDYYAYVDSIVGDALAQLRGDDVLMVVSAFGMEPLPVAKRLLERIVGDPRFTGTHERAPDGFLMAFGAPVGSGRLSRGAVVEVVPTLLYFLGLPAGRDMDGSPRTDIFTPAFNAQRTMTFIPTYE